VRHQFSVEKISVVQAPVPPPANRSVRIQLVGMMTEAEANLIVHIWRNKSPVNVEEILATAGHIVTIDFTGEG
jgi:hypothetical protein